MATAFEVSPVGRRVQCGPESDNSARLAAALSNYQLGIGRPLTPQEIQHFRNMAKMVSTPHAPVDPTLPTPIEEVTYVANALVEHADAALSAARRLENDTEQIAMATLVHEPLH